MPVPSSALPKALGLITILAGLLYVGHAWLNHEAAPGTALQPSTPGEPTGTAATPGGTTAPSTPARRLDAQVVAQAYARDRQEADARFKGRRLQLQGVVEQVEAGQGQILLITLGASEQQAGLRAVVDLAAQVAQATRPAVGQVLSLDCLNQGLLMAEPVLSDCRLPSP